MRLANKLHSLTHVYDNPRPYAQSDASRRGKLIAESCFAIKIQAPCNGREGREEPAIATSDLRQEYWGERENDACYDRGAPRIVSEAPRMTIYILIVSKKVLPR